MKMIQAAAQVDAELYYQYVHNCTRNPACELPFSAALPAVAALQLYVDFGTEEPGDVEFILIDHCTGEQSQIIPEEYVIGQTPELGYYGVFRLFNNPATPVTTFVVCLQVPGKTFFTELLQVEPCRPLMKVKACYPQAAEVTGFDVNGIYYGLPFVEILGDGNVRYFHTAWVRDGKLREISNKATFKSSIYFTFSSVVEKIFQFQPGELIAKWYKDVLLGIYTRGAISVNDGPPYIVSDLNFESINDDDAFWKPYAQVKETTNLYFGCDDGICEECCTPSVTGATAEAGGDPGSDSGSGGSESSSVPDPLGLRFRFMEGNYPEAASTSLEDWNAFFDTAANADTPFTSLELLPGTNEIILYGCTNLTISIGLFTGSNGITGIFDDGGCVVNIQDNAFALCTNLVEIDFPAVTMAANGAFTECTALTTMNFPVLATPGQDMFFGCTSLVNVSLPSLVNTALDMFTECTNLESVDLPNVLTCYNKTFKQCSALVTVNMPAVTTFTEEVFLECTAIEELNFPNLVTIGPRSFRECNNLRDLICPAATTLGDYLFEFCTSLENVDLRSADFDDAGVFINCTGNTFDLTILTAEASDPDIISVQSNNTVTLILV